VQPPRFLDANRPALRAHDVAVGDVVDSLELCKRPNFARLPVFRLVGLLVSAAAQRRNQPPTIRLDHEIVSVRKCFVVVVVVVLLLADESCGDLHAFSGHASL
jgi:hypothetical protein